MRDQAREDVLLLLLILGRGYEIGYATADNVRGPWTRYAGNPIYGAQDPAGATQYKHVATLVPGSPFRQVGHGSIFKGPDGRLWTTAHAFRAGDQVLNSHLVFDPLNFHDGVFDVTEPSYTVQTVDVLKP